MVKLIDMPSKCKQYVIYNITIKNKRIKESIYFGEFELKKNLKKTEIWLKLF